MELYTIAAERMTSGSVPGTGISRSNDEVRNESKP